MDIPYADEVIHFPLEKSMWSPGNFKAAAALCKKVKKERYSLISTHTSLAAFFTRLALGGLRERPLVANMVHGYLFDDGTSWLKRTVLLAAELWMAPVTDLVLTMNRWDYEAAVQYRLGRKVVHIPGVGVDFSRLHTAGADMRRQLRTELNISDSAFVLFNAAEFSARKSQTVLIQAMAHLPEQVVLVLAGDGALQGECRAQVQRLGVADRVRFLGHVKDMGPWYDMADAAASASRIEGLPFNIMEAMYAGLPVVASDVKGHSDLIADGETGLLYPYGDEQAYAKQISRLLASEKLRRHLGANGRENAQQYALENVFSEVWGEYAKLSSEDVYALQHEY